MDKTRLTNTTSDGLCPPNSMSLYKYFSVEGAHRFFSTWSLRITPPDQFNDPFEMCPPIEILNEDQAFAIDGIQIEFVRQIEKDLAPQIAGGLLESSFPSALSSCLLGLMSKEDERKFTGSYPQLEALLPLMRTQLNSELKRARDAFPLFTEHVEKLMHAAMRNLGTLCMSRNGRHPLMWAHYAQDHRGLVVEFDPEASCFKVIFAKPDPWILV